MKYTKTQTVSKEQQFTNMKPGQWFRWSGAGGARGQYLGLTRSGMIVCRYQQGKFGKASDLQRNKLQRQFAVQQGSK